MTQCNYCDKKFLDDDGGGLKKHERKMHKHKCKHPDCTQGFKSKELLAKHQIDTNHFPESSKKDHNDKQSKRKKRKAHALDQEVNVTANDNDDEDHDNKPGDSGNNQKDNNEVENKVPKKQRKTRRSEKSIRSEMAESREDIPEANDDDSDVTLSPGVEADIEESDADPPKKRRKKIKKIKKLCATDAISTAHGKVATENKVVSIPIHFQESSFTDLSSSQDAEAYEIAEDDSAFAQSPKPKSNMDKPHTAMRGAESDFKEEKLSDNLEGHSQNVGNLSTPMSDIHDSMSGEFVEVSNTKDMKTGGKHDEAAFIIGDNQPQTSAKDNNRFKKSFDKHKAHNIVEQMLPKYVYKRRLKQLRKREAMELEAYRRKQRMKKRRILQILRECHY